MPSLVAVTVFLAAQLSLVCGGQEQGPSAQERKGEQAVTQSSQAKGVRVRLKVDGKEVVLKLRDSAATRDLVEQLPLTVKLSDHAHTEKVAYPPKKLSTKGAPAGYDPSVGDVTYYAPWGNLAIFYKDFGYAKGLVPLGVVESGLEDLAALHGDRSVVIERIADK